MNRHSFSFVYDSQSLQDQAIGLLQTDSNMAQTDEEFREIVDQYRNRMEQIAENQNFLPLRYFQEAEHLIRSELIHSVKEAGSVASLEKALLEWRGELYSRNQHAISKWCNELLVDSTNSIEKKIGRQIKSFPTYRQEILKTLQFLRKKVDPYLTCDLASTIQDFIVQKIIENAIQLNALSLTQLQEQLKIVEIENKALQVECRQFKRRTSKQESENSRIIAQLKDSLSIAEAKCSILEETNEQLRGEIRQCQELKEESMQKIAEQYDSEMSQLRERLEKCYQETRQANKRATFFEMEFQKEQLLHKQTMLHYQQLVSSYHSKEEELKEEILQASRVSEQEIGHYKILSTRRIEDCQQTASQLEQQLQENQQALRSKEAEVLALRDDLIAEKQRSRTEINSLANKIMQFELKTKILEQKQSQCESLRQRLLRLQAQNKRLQRDKEQLQQLCKTSEKEKLIAQQKYQYLKVQYQDQHAKNIQLSDLLYHKQKEVVERKRSFYIIEKAEMFTQTQEEQKQKIIKQAISLLGQLQSEFRKSSDPKPKKKR